MALTGANNEQKIWNFLTGHGMSEQGAAGMMGNIYAESGLLPNNLQNTGNTKLKMTDAEYTVAVDSGSYTNFAKDGQGYGLCQWTFWSRKAALLEYAKAAGKSVGDLETQLLFLMKELGESFKSVLSVLKSAGTVREASDAVLLNFERPANTGESVRVKRAGYGQGYFDKYAKKTATPATGGGTTGGKITTGKQLAQRAEDVARNYKTLYIMGCFGAPMNEANKKRYCNNHTYNKAAARQKMIQAASADTFGFDCVCLIKGLLWGWSGDKSKTYGGAVYQANGVPDIGADTMIARCSGVSTDFSNIEVGEAVWLSGHIGVYIGGGLAVECSPAWENRVQITAVANIGAKAGYNSRRWLKHGKLPYVTYDGAASSTAPAPSAPSTSAPKQEQVEAAQYFDKAQARAYKVDAKSGLNIRTGAGTEKKSMGVLKNGTTVRCYGYYNKVGKTIWLYVAVNGITGYVCKDWLK